MPEPGQDETAAVVFLVTGDITKPYSAAHSRHWQISAGSAETFAAEMTKRYGDPGEAMQSLDALAAGSREGFVLLDPGEDAP